MAKRRKTPGYLHHKPRNLAYVRLPGRKKPIYLGQYDSPESRSRYEEIIADWQRNQDVDRHTLSVDELALRYIEHARKHYRKNGRETSEVASIRAGLRVLVAIAGKLRARDFGPLKLQEVRDAMIARNWKRRSINSQIGRIRRAFGWAESQEIIPLELPIDSKSFLACVRVDRMPWSLSRSCLFLMQLSKQSGPISAARSGP